MRGTKETINSGLIYLHSLTLTLTQRIGSHTIRSPRRKSGLPPNAVAQITLGRC